MYGWLVVVDDIARGDKLKWNEVFELDVKYFLNLVQYRFHEMQVKSK
jgi:hypothetical protein